jgi:hypothetical protein
MEPAELMSYDGSGVEELTGQKINTPAGRLFRRVDGGEGESIHHDENRRFPV